MALKDTLTLTDVLMGLENTLRIDYTERDINRLAKKSKENLENSLRIRLDEDIFSLQMKNQFLGDSVGAFIIQITENLKSLSLHLCLSMFYKQYGQTIKEVSYLGFAPEQLLGALKFLQDNQLYENRNQFFESLAKSTEYVEMGAIRRLLTIMVVLESLGLKEGVGIIAQYLYIGGI